MTTKNQGEDKIMHDFLKHPGTIDSCTVSCVERMGEGRTEAFQMRSVVEKQGHISLRGK